MFANSQMPSNEQQAVLEVIQQVFDGMREGDSAKVKAQFLPEGSLHFMGEDQKGTPRYGKGNMDKWLEGIAQEKSEIWNEQIYKVEVRIDDRMASVWAPYKFYLGSSFHHCGVNVILLFKGEKGWKIRRITDTHRESDCL